MPEFQCELMYWFRVKAKNVQDAELAIGDIAIKNPKTSATVTPQYVKARRVKNEKP